jgi:hypothetical protein
MSKSGNLWFWSVGVVAPVLLLLEACGGETRELPDSSVISGTVDAAAACGNACDVGAVDATTTGTGQTDSGTGQTDASAPCGNACDESNPICDNTTMTCRPPQSCDLCNVDADCGSKYQCYAFKGQKMCAANGTSCESSGYCCTVQLAGNGYSTLSCNPNVSCTQPGGLAALPPRAGATDGGTADATASTGAPRCYPCDRDSDCEPGLVCGQPQGGPSITMCVPSSQVVECCLGTGVSICLYIDGSKHIP